MATSIKKDYIRYKDFFLNISRFYNSRPDYKIYLELVLTIVTITIFSIFAIRPTILTIIELNKEIKGKEETLVKLKTKIKNLQTANNLLSEKQDVLFYALEAVPQRSSPETLISQIEKLATGSSLTIKGLTVTDAYLIGTGPSKLVSEEYPALPESANELVFSFSVTGEYQNLYSFLTQVENMRRPLKFDSFAITSSISEDKKTLVMTVLGRVPYIYEEN